MTCRQCNVIRGRINLCPLHAAAKKMRALLKHMHEQLHGPALDITMGHGFAHEIRTLLKASETGEGA